MTHKLPQIILRFLEHIQITNVENKCFLGNHHSAASVSKHMGCQRFRKYPEFLSHWHSCTINVLGLSYGKQLNNLSTGKIEWVKNLSLVRQKSHLLIFSENQSWNKFGNLTCDHLELYPYQNVNMHQGTMGFSILPDALMYLTSFHQQPMKQEVWKPQAGIWYHI